MAEARTRHPLNFIVLASLALLAGCSAFDLRTFHTLRNFAGKGAIDCGVALFPANIPRVNACAIGASVEGVPFFFRYQLKHEPTINRGFVRTANGNLLEVSVEDPSDSRQDKAPVTVPCENDSLIPDPTVTDLKLLTCKR